MKPDHQNAIDAIERHIKAIWIELEGLGLSLGVDKQCIEAAKDSAQDLIGSAKMAVNNEL